MERRVLIDISGKYVDPKLILFAQQKKGTSGDNAQIEIFVQGAPEPVLVGKGYWQNLCSKYFELKGPTE